MPDYVSPPAWSVDSLAAKEFSGRVVFDSGKIAAGDKFEFTFKQTGKFEYGCDYHPRMKGVIEVAD